MLIVFTLSTSSFKKAETSNKHNLNLYEFDCGAAALEFYQVISNVKDPFYALLDAIEYYEFCEEYENTPEPIGDLD